LPFSVFTPKKHQKQKNYKFMKINLNKNSQCSGFITFALPPDSCFVVCSLSVIQIAVVCWLLALNPPKERKILLVAVLVLELALIVEEWRIEKYRDILSNFQKTQLQPALRQQSTKSTSSGISLCAVPCRSSLTQSSVEAYLFVRFSHSPIPPSVSLGEHLANTVLAFQCQQILNCRRVVPRESFEVFDCPFAQMKTEKPLNKRIFIKFSPNKEVKIEIKIGIL
jgi:hypothetical protein